MDDPDFTNDAGMNQNIDVESSHEFDTDKTCLICFKEMTPTNKKRLGDKAKGTVIAASKRRKDNKFRMMEKVTNLTLHSNCFCVYIRENSILSALKKLKQKNETKRESMEAVRMFDFKNQCFICEQPANKRKIHYIKHSATTLAMIENLNEKKDLNEYEKFLLLRLEIVAEKFKDTKCFYHKACYTRFYKYDTRKLPGRPLSDNMTKILDFIIDHIISNDDECQFSVQTILKNFEGDKSNVEMRYVKKNLKSHFGDDIEIDSSNGDLRVRFLAKSYENFYNKSSPIQMPTKKEDRENFLKIAAHIVLEDIRAALYETEKYKSPSTFLDEARSCSRSALYKFF